MIATAGLGSYLNFWILFGASNQLLAALTLLAITVWLSNAHKRFAFTLLPTVFILIMTLWALGTLTLANFRSAQGLDMPFFNALASIRADSAGGVSDPHRAVQAAAFTHGAE